MRRLGPPASDVGGWVLRGGVAAFYLAFGWDKFDANPHNGWIQIFERIGFGQWFRIATGLIEMVAGLLYVVPWTTWPAAVLLSATMVGAIVAHFTVLHDPGASVVPAVALIATIGIALREPDRDLRGMLSRHE